jgi:phosphonate transport system ATP-binding protein
MAFGDFRALSAVSIRIYPGELVALVGPSGAGKSTLLNLLNGSLFPSDGEVRVNGESLARLSASRLREVQRQIGTIYQRFHLVDNLPVIHNVNAGHLGRWSFPKALFSLLRPLEVAKAFDALNKVGIPEKLYARVDQLSGGQQQRVALARVLVQQPSAILADEPIASLDPRRGGEIMDLLSSLSREQGAVLVCSLHSVEFVRSHFTRVIGLRAGQVTFDIPVADFTPSVMQRLYAE